MTFTFEFCPVPSIKAGESGEATNPVDSFGEVDLEVFTNRKTTPITETIIPRGNVAIVSHGKTIPISLPKGAAIKEMIIGARPKMGPIHINFLAVALSIPTPLYFVDGTVDLYLEKTPERLNKLDSARG